MARAAVAVAGEVVAAIDHGLLALVGVGHEDSDADAAVVAAKLAGLRIFSDDQGKMNLAVADVGGEVLVVSQFTLLGDVRKGRRPSFVAAADPDHAAPLVQAVADHLDSLGVGTRTGSFGAMMEVELVNDGPVTLVLDTVAGAIR